MPSQNFEASLPFILRWEGGSVDHPADPGGRTNKGVTQKVYDGWRARQAPFDLGDTAYIARIPDLGEDPSYDQ